MLSLWFMRASVFFVEWPYESLVGRGGTALSDDAQLTLLSWVTSDSCEVSALYMGRGWLSIFVAYLSQNSTTFDNFYFSIFSDKKAKTFSKLATVAAPICKDFLCAINCMIARFKLPFNSPGLPVREAYVPEPYTSSMMIC